MHLSIDNVQTVNASSSQPNFPYDNLDPGRKGPWRAKFDKLNPPWLNFDLGKSFIPKKIRVVSTLREMAPKQMIVDYFGNDRRLIGRDIARVTFEAASSDYMKYQDFNIVYEQHAVQYVRVRILSNWGAKFVQVNQMLFYGKESKKGLTADGKSTLGNLESTHMTPDWDVHDRVRYKWEEGQKWYEGQIVHVNEVGEETTYLIKDDYGWHKNDIRLCNIREPRYHRKPRRMTASCPELSLGPILEDCSEDGLSSDKDNSPSMKDGAEEKELYSITPKSCPKGEHHKSLKSISPKRMKIIVPEHEDNTSDTIGHSSRQPELVVDDSPRKREMISRKPDKISSLKKSKRTPKAPVAITRTTSKATTPKKTSKRVIHSQRGGTTLLAKNFTKKRINGIWKQCARQEGSPATDKRPMFKNSQGLVLWWFSNMETWMISKQHQVGSNRSYAFVHDNCFHPMDIKGRWRSYNKMLAEKWGWDQGIITTPSQPEHDDNLTLVGIMRNRSQHFKNERNSHKPQQPMRIITAGTVGEIVLWKVVLQGFRMSKLNSVYLRDQGPIAGRHSYISPSGLVLWWYSRRQFWMVSPKHLVGTDKSYACIHHKSIHPKNISGIWQVFDRDQRRFINDEGAMVRPGIAEKISLEGFPERLNLNGIYIEKRQRHGQPPTLVRYNEKDKITCALFFREETREWCITNENNLDGTPLAVFHDPSHIVIYSDISPLRNLLRNRGVWKDELDRTLSGRVV